MTASDTLPRTGAPYSRRRRSDRLTYTASKEQELAHFRAFVDSLDEGTYLHSLLEGFEDYAEAQIRSDMAIAPVPLLPEMERRIWEMEVAVKAARDQAVAAERESGRLRLYIEELRKAVSERDRLQEALDREQTARQVLENEAAGLRAEITRLQQELAAAQLAMQRSQMLRSSFRTPIVEEADGN